MMTKLQILEETKNFYSKDTTKRAYNKDTRSCYYLQSETGNMCAVGRCMRPGVPDDSDGDIYDYAERKLYNAQNIDSVLKKRYHGHSLNFWKDLQYFHDKDSFWNENGLTEIGQKEYENLKKRHAR